MKKLSSADLKLIAMSTMFLDHIGAIIIEKTELYWMGAGASIDFVLRQIGRLSFPIYCFLLVEAFFHTRDRKRYAFRMLVLAFLSEIQYDMAFSLGWNWERNNVLFTLLLGFIMLLVLEKIEGRYSGNKVYLVSLIPVGITCMLSMAMHSSYTYMGILVIAFLYLFRREKKLKFVLGSLVLIGTPAASLGFVCAYHYNGEKGSMKMPNWCYQYFYPLHILLLLGTRSLLEFLI